MKIDIRFKQNFEKTKETEKLIQHFGLDNIKENIIVENFNFPYTNHKIYYFCGYSGSGKSSIIREIFKQLDERDKDDYNVTYIEKWQELDIPNKPLVEFFPEVPIEDRLSIMAKCGLGEAWKFISYYNDLSDGEKFRFILYYQIMTLAKSSATHKVLIFDEFCATLDRVTAKVIANNISKIRDKTGIGFILASAHDDLTQYIHADYNYFKEFTLKVQRK